MSVIKTLHRFPRDKQLAPSSSAIMAHVMFALIPGIFASILFYGVGTVIQLSLGMLTALICEWLAAVLRRRRLGELDLLTGLLTAMLLALSLPPTAPYYIVIWGVVIGILIGKHAYGGAGMNIFNPAMVGFCAVYLSFPAEIGLYPKAMIGFADSFRLIFGEHPLADMVTGATNLAGLKANGTIYQESSRHLWLNGAWLVGGLYLWLRNFADWRLSWTFIAVFCLSTLIFSPFSDLAISFGQHFGLGALIFTACFIVTDPTSAATGQRGRLVYAALCALLAVIIRQFSQLPDSMAFAVLLANCCAPLIDGLTRPNYYRGK